MSKKDENTIKDLLNGEELEKEILEEELEVLYRPIFEGKNKRTIGKRILAIK